MDNYLETLIDSIHGHYLTVLFLRQQQGRSGGVVGKLAYNFLINYQCPIQKRTV